MERTASTIIVATSNGTSAHAVPALQITKNYAGALSNKSSVAVLDFVSFAYDNRDGGTAKSIQIDVTPYGSSYPIWRALAICPAAEAITIDKCFEDGLPLWGRDELALSSGGDIISRFGASNGVAQGASGTYTCAYVSVKVDDSEWWGSPGGLDCLSVGYHIEPASARRD